MIKKTLLTIFLAAVFLSCEKEEPLPAHAELFGSWLWESSSGGIAGQTIKAKPEERRVLKFTQNGQFTEFLNNTTVRTANYTIALGKTITATDSIPLITYNEGYFPQSFAVSGNKLTLFDEVYDGFTSGYVRVDE